MATGGTQYRQHVRHDKILERVDAQELDQSSKICLPKLKILFSLVVQVKLAEPFL